MNKRRVVVSLAFFGLAAGFTLRRYAQSDDDTWAKVDLWYFYRTMNASYAQP